MKRFFLLMAIVLLAANSFAGRTFNGTEVLYLNASAVSWWQDGNAVQVATFDGATKVVGVVAADPSKVGFTVPAGTYSTVVFSRHSSADADPWNKTGEISLDGTTDNMVNTFAENSSDVTWANYDGAEAEKPACPDHLYALGNIKNVGWTPGSGAELTKDGNKFTGTYTFEPDGSNEICYFCFTTTTSTDWGEVNSNRFGTTGQLQEGTPVSIKAGGDGTNVTIAPGTYTITVDWDAYTVTAVAGEAPEETKPECPAQLSVLGNIENVGWVPAGAKPMTKEGNKFTGTYTFVADGDNEICYFCFTGADIDALAGDDTDWTVVNGNRFGTAETLVVDGEATDLTYPGEKTATIAPGTFTIIVDWDALKVSATSVTDAIVDVTSQNNGLRTVKMAKNGNIIICQGDKTYNAVGARVK